MRRTRKVPIKQRKIEGICVKIHPSLFEKMETIRKQNQNKWGVSLSQVEASGILARRINVTGPTSVDIIGGNKNAKVKKKQKR